ncbi:MAG: DUF1835 domain-containing protein [Candidatus Dormibacteria bacterium]
MLHVTNGDTAGEMIQALRRDEPVVRWRDVLHEGPVLSGLSDRAYRETRARFIAAASGLAVEEVERTLHERDSLFDTWPQHDEVVLWFEDDLYDQLQLVEVLQRMRGTDTSRVTLTEVEGGMYRHQDRMGAVCEARVPVTPAMVDEAAGAWQALTSPDPRRLAELRDRPLMLPNLGAALVRLLEEYPGRDDGLARSERQILETITGEPLPAGRVFQVCQEAEERPFMGDGSFWRIVWRLADGSRPLLTYDGPRTKDSLRDGSAGAASVSITSAGREVLAGRSDAVRMNGIDRWIGGVHLEGQATPWRWDGQSLHLVPL